MTEGQAIFTIGLLAIGFAIEVSGLISNYRFLCVIAGLLVIVGGIYSITISATGVNYWLGFAMIIIGSILFFTYFTNKDKVDQLPDIMSARDKAYINGAQDVNGDYDEDEYERNKRARDYQVRNNRIQAMRGRLRGGIRKSKRSPYRID